MIERLRWVTHAILPLVYDESLSYVELLNKVVAKLNEVITQSNNLSETVKQTVLEWIDGDGHSVIVSAVGEFIEKYSTTKDFQTALVGALENVPDLQGSAQMATFNWLNGVGSTVVNDSVKDYLTEYVKTVPFKELVQEYVQELNDILRGNTLNIKQKQNIQMYSPEIEINSVDMANDYSTNNSFGKLFMDKFKSILSFGLKKFIIAENSASLNTDLDMIEHRITNLGNPVNPTDAINKQYAEALIRVTGSGVDILKAVYSEDDGRYHVQKLFSEVSAEYPLVYLKADDGRCYYPFENNGASITFANIEYGDGWRNIRTLVYSSDNVLTYTNYADNVNNYINRNGRISMGASLNMATNKIVSLKDGENDGDAVNYKQLMKYSPKVFYGSCEWTDGKLNNITGLSFSEISRYTINNCTVLIELTPTNKENTTIIFRFIGINATAGVSQGRLQLNFMGYTFNVQDGTVYPIILRIYESGEVSTSTYSDLRVI